MPVFLMARFLRSCLVLVLCSLVIAPAGQALAASASPENRLAQAMGSTRSAAPAQLKDAKSVLA